MADTTTGGQRIEIRARAVWLALVGVLPLSLFVQWSDITVGGTIVAGPFPPAAASILWAGLLGINALSGIVARRRGGAAWYNCHELLVILAVWLIANVVAGRGLLHPLLASIAGPVYYAQTPNVENAVANHIPNWLAVTDRAAAKGFFEGSRQGVPWKLWALPLTLWSLFFLPFTMANVCLCALFERIWVRNERLSFPLVALPIESIGFGPGGIERPTHPFWQSLRVPFLLGMMVPVVLHGLGVLHIYFPVIPEIPLQIDMSAINAVYPYTVLNPLYLHFYPILVGVTFLAPTDVTMGVWLFVLLNKAEMFLTAISGWNEGQITNMAKSVPPYVEEQSAGAYLALGALLIWHARNHLRNIASAMFPSSDPPTEYTTYRPLAWGFVLGVAGILGWCLLAGFPLWFAAAFFGFYGIVALVLSRLMAEGGVSWILAPILPDKLLISFFGSTSLSTMVITRTILLMQHLRDTRQMLLPALFEVGKLRDVSRFPLRRFYGLLMAAIVLSLIVGGAVALPTFYKYGATMLVPSNDGLAMSVVVIPRSGIQQAADRLQNPVPPSPEAGIAVVIGAVVAYGLSVLRLRYAWWPLHPLGYALTGTLQLGYANKMLFSIFVGWLFKTLVQRFGGMTGFRYLRGVAFGLIVGDLLMGGVIKGLDALLGPSQYALF